MKNRTSAIAMVGLALVSVFGISGCNLFKRPLPDPTPNVGSHHRPASTIVRRVAVMPMESQYPDREQAALLQSALVNALRGEGAFELIEIRPEDLGPCRPEVIESGQYDEQQLVWLMKKFNVDAVMYSRLNHVRNVPPQAWNAICHLVDVREAMVITSAEGAWNLADPGDSLRLKKFLKLNEFGLVDPTLAGEIPGVVAAFVATELALEIY